MGILNWYMYMGSGTRWTVVQKQMCLSIRWQRTSFIFANHYRGGKAAVQFQLRCGYLAALSNCFFNFPKIMGVSDTGSWGVRQGAMGLKSGHRLEAGWGIWDLYSLPPACCDNKIQWQAEVHLDREEENISAFRKGYSPSHCNTRLRALIICMLSECVQHFTCIMSM